MGHLRPPPGDAATTQTLNGTRVLPRTGGTLRFEPTAIEGTGSLVALDPLSGVDGKAHFRLRFRLEEGGMVVVHLFSNRDLEQGVQLTLQRTGKALSGKLTKAGATSIDLTESLKGVSAEGEVTLGFDAHNNESPMHFLLWDGVEVAPVEANALYNSEEGGSPGKGAGALWGISLDRAKVLEASVQAAKFTEGD